MTNHANGNGHGPQNNRTHRTKVKSPLRDYLLLVLVILVVTPLAVWRGHMDGLKLAAEAYDGAAGAGDSGAGDDDYEDYDDYEDEDSEDGESGESAAAGSGLPEATEESVARGAALFRVHCTACHGEKGDGQGPAAVAFSPAPRDFTDPAARWTIGRDPESIHKAVSEGIPGTGMAGFAAALSEDELRDVVHYVGSLSGAADGR